MRLFERADKLSITNYLRIAKNATMEFVDSLGQTQSITANELATQTTGGRGTSLTAASTITASQNGKTFYLNLAGGFETTLPPNKAGLKYRFVVETAPTTAYTIVTDSSDNVINGSICSPEVSALVSVVADADTATFVANLAVVGDYIDFESSATGWFISGMVFVQDGATTTQAS